MGKKVLIISTSLRPNANSEILARETERGAKDAGHEVEFVTLKDKVIIYGCLGYFICPIDLVPDFFPFMGFLDDIALLTWCFYKVKVNITEAIKEKAKTKLTTWFADYDPKLIKEF